MRVPRTLAAKLGLIGAALLLLALGSIGVTLSVTWKLEGGAAAVNEAGRMRMQTWRLAQTLAAGDAAGLQQQVRQFDQNIALLQSGDPARPLFVPRGARSEAAFAAVRRDWLALRARWSARPAPAADAVARDAQAYVETIDAFVGAIESQLSIWTALLNAVQLAMMALAIGAAVTLLYAAYLFIFAPLSRLQEALARAESGDLAARVTIGSADEFGAVGHGFNQMAERLQGLYQNLEAKVREKTEHFEAEHRRLAALYEASALAARAGSLEELARHFAHHLRVVSGADAAAVRWSDEANRRYLLLGSDCLPASIVDGEPCLLTGECLCGQPQGEARTRVIPIRDAAPRDLCLRAGFELLVNVPVRMQDRQLGEIDLLYRNPRAFDAADRALYEALAMHLAGAMEGQRAIALDREAAIAEERGLLARELHDSIAQSLAFVKIQVQLLRGALERADGPAAQRALGELDAGVQESTADVRELLLHFRTRTNAEDITPALQTTLRKFEHQTGLPTHLEVLGHGLPLAPDVQVQVLHVVQEALSNVRKHANASAVWVDVEQAPRWRVSVRDDGRGFGGTASDETHVGLRIMRERARTIGADVDVQSGPGAGTRVVLTLPEAA
ncbi:MAG: type IV pili methyl-accepting chemotaxis transducer N-terminal domain-containing protein [Proteobacteria bacterium]|nr:type IV pili methyl-accepting chemotaxis transducer N-terminal domain-containing protein [Pseudomonadota bacterium]